LTIVIDICDSNTTVWKKRNLLPRPQYQTHSSTYKIAYIDVCKTHHTITVYTNVFLKQSPRVRNT